MSLDVGPPPTAVLRRMRWWDVEAVAALEATLFTSGAWSAETFWSELAGEDPVSGRGSRHYLVAERDGAVVGYAGLAVTGREADVQTVAVAPGEQGRGTGRALLEAVLRTARRRGATAVLLEVRADGAAALRLYESAGFEQVGVRRRYYQPEGVDALVMRLRLRAQARDG